MNGLETEDFATALDLEERREAELPERLKFARPYSYFSRGLYADLLTPYFRLFPRDQLLILRFDDLVQNPAGVADRLHDFLGLTRRPGDVDGLGAINPSEKAGAGLDVAVRRELGERYADANRRLVTMVGPEFEHWIV